MSDELLGFFKEAYQNDSVCVLILDSRFSLVWHNGKPAPFTIQSDTDFKAELNIMSEEMPDSGDYSYYHDGILYEYHLNNVSDKYFIISCSYEPALIRFIGNSDSRKTLENILSSRFVNTQGIAAAAASLNDKFEELDITENSEKELYQQLNIIMGHCSHILKEHYIFNEVLLYQNEESEPETTDCAMLIEDFVKQCKYVIGSKNGSHIICHAEPDLPVNVSGKRLHFLMLCLLVEIFRNSSEVLRIVINGEENNGIITIGISASPVGETPDIPPLLSRSTPIHKDSPEFANCGTILEAFQNKYSCKISKYTFLGNIGYRICLPVADISQGIHLSSNGICRTDYMISPYHAMLFDISDFRYY